MATRPLPLAAGRRGALQIRPPWPQRPLRARRIRVRRTERRRALLRRRRVGEVRRLVLTIPRPMAQKMHQMLEALIHESILMCCWRL